MCGSCTYVSRTEEKGTTVEDVLLSTAPDKDDYNTLLHEMHTDENYIKQKDACLELQYLSSCHQGSNGKCVSIDL